MFRFLRTLGVLGAIAFVVSLYTPIWNFAAARLAESPDIRKADAVVVLGAGLWADNSLGDESLRRAVYGMQLFKAGFGDVLVVSGPKGRAVPVKSEAGVRRDIAVQLGMDADRIKTIVDVSTTRDEARLVASFLGERNSKTILLVTESLHMRRAKRVFERAGLTVFTAPSDNLAASAVAAGGRLQLIPRVVEQGMALFYYRLAGYI